MRSFIAFMACTGFIIWAHSCDTRIVGVKVYAHTQHAAPVMAKTGSVQQKDTYKLHLLSDNSIRTISLDTLYVTARRRYDTQDNQRWDR